MRRGYCLGLVIAILIALGMVLVVPVPAGASAPNAYSVGFEDSQGNTYLGNVVQRYDQDIPAGGVCNPSFSGNYVLQAQWLTIAAGGPDDWIEFGTLSKSTNCKYWYEAYGLNGVFNVIHTPQAITRAQHTFKIIRGPTGNTWQWWIDVTLWDEEPIFVQNIGSSVSAGLESWNLSAPVLVHGYYSLEYVVPGGAYYYWAGEDPPVIDNPPMCGGWTSPTFWRASENDPC